MSARPDWPVRDVILYGLPAGLAAAVLAITAAQLGPALAIAAVAVTGILALAMLRPIWAIYLSLILLPLESATAQFGGFGITPTEFTALAAAAGALLQWLARGEGALPSSPLTLPLLALLLAHIPGLILAEDKLAVAKQLVMWSAFYVIFLAIISERSAALAVRLAWLIALVGGIIAGYAIYTSLGTSQGLLEAGAVATGRATGSFSHPAALGLFIVISFPLQLAMAARTRGVWRLLAAAAAMLSVWALALSLSRGSFLAFFVAVLLLVLLWRPARRIAAALVPVVLLMWLTGLGPVRSAIDTEVLIERLNSIPNTTAEPARLRLQLYEETPRMIADHPLFGVGADNFSQAAPAYGLPPPTKDTYVGHAHNLPLAVAAELGLLGLAALVWLAVALGQTLLRLIRSEVEPAHSLGIALGAAFLGIATVGLVDYVFSNNPMTLSVMVLAAVAVSLSRIPVAEASRPAPKGFEFPQPSETVPKPAM